MMDDLLREALHKAFLLGQTYWQQADSEYTSQHKKAGETKGKFFALVDDTCARIQQRLDTGGWIAGSIIDASEPFRSVDPTFVGKPIWTWRESDGQWFRHDPLPALPKEK